MSRAWLVFVCSIISFAANIQYGFSSVYLNTPVDEFKDYLNESLHRMGHTMTDATYGWMWNLILNIWFVGFFVGIWLSPLLNDRFGRKVGFLAGNALSLLSACLRFLSILCYWPWLLFIARLMGSIAMAVVYQSCILYLQEISPTHLRGFSSFISEISFAVMCIVGTVVGTDQLLGHHLPWLVFCPIVPTAVLFCVQIFLPETPKFLLVVQQDKEATVRSVRFYHGPSANVEEVMAEISQEASGESDAASSFSSLLELFTVPHLRKATLLSCAALQNTCALWSIILSSTYFLEQAGVSPDIAKWIHKWNVYGLGTVDMICTQVRMTPLRRRFINFTYPILVQVRQVFLLRQVDSTSTSVFLLRPFTFRIWVIVLFTVLAVLLTFIVFRRAEWRGNETFLSSIINGFCFTLTVTTNINFITNGLSRVYGSQKMFTGMWAILWAHLFLDFYTSNLRGILSSSQRTTPPFDDFNTMVEQLKLLHYRLISSSLSSYPVCPLMSAEDCDALWAGVYALNPPYIGTNDVLLDHDVNAAQPIPLVGFAWYPEERVPYAISVWTDRVFNSRVWVIRDIAVSPAALPHNLSSHRRAEVDRVIQKAIQAFVEIDRHYVREYPEAQMIKSVRRAAFTLSQVESVFYFLFGMYCIAVLLFLLQLLVAHSRRVSDGRVPGGRGRDMFGRRSTLAALGRRVPSHTRIALVHFRSLETAAETWTGEVEEERGVL